jgi:hypothetical protein
VRRQVADDPRAGVEPREQLVRRTRLDPPLPQRGDEKLEAGEREAGPEPVSVAACSGNGSAASRLNREPDLYRWHQPDAWDRARYRSPEIVEDSLRPR